ncbi:bacillithiol system redox-active protein YtxJ [Flavobacteriaceae bacterium GSB9]|nr:bacillithiol system redox-active protein YtxJ [Flavobacteriaceae bacterium GSB9]
MGLLNKLFGNSETSKEEKTLSWIALNDLTQLEDIQQKSTAKTQVIFKHSTRCGISRMVKKQFEGDYKFSENEADLYYLDLISYRDISNDIANKFQVRHESPQLLVIKNGTVTVHDSHGAINNIDLSQHI